LSKQKNKFGRRVLFGLVALSAAFSIDHAGAGYRYYPWCAQYNLPGGPTSCRFATFEQCLPEVRGVGGQCVVNPYPPSYYSSQNTASRRSGRKYRRSPRR
jgi:hypothetical protein